MRERERERERGALLQGQSFGPVLQCTGLETMWTMWPILDTCPNRVGSSAKPLLKARAFSMASYEGDHIVFATLFV